MADTRPTTAPPNALFDSRKLDQDAVGGELLCDALVEFRWSAWHGIDRELLQLLLRGRRLQDLACDRVELLDDRRRRFGRHEHPVPDRVVGIGISGFQRGRYLG